jgi:hypothetical protein
MRKQLWATILGGLTAGFLDHVSALASAVTHGVSVTQAQQYVASGILGPTAAFAGGWMTSVLGLGVHFSLTTAMAGIFVATSRRFPLILRYPWYTGPAYGALIYFVMTYIIVPLSAVPSWTPARGWAMLGGLEAHCLYVGLPIAAIARIFLADLPAMMPARSARAVG